MLRAHFAAWVALMLLLAGQVSAQQSDCRQRIIPLNVFNSKNGQVIDPTSLNFRASYRGKPVRVISVTASEHPPRVLVLFDISGSTTSPLIRQGRFLPPATGTSFAVLDGLLRDLPSRDQVALAVFGSRMELLVSLTSNRKELADAVDALRQSVRDAQKRLGNQTALWNALQDSMPILGKSEIGDTIYLITDGEDTTSKTQAESVVRVLSAGGIRLFLYRLRETRSSETSLESIMKLGDLVRDTGGWSLGSTNVPALGGALDLQHKLVQNYFRLNVELPETVDRLHDWTLELTNVADPLRKDLVLVYPHKLSPCS